MNIEKATIVGVLQDWDINDNRVDMELIGVDVPLEALAFYEENDIKSMCHDTFYGGDDDSLLGELINIGIDDAWFKPRRFFWRPEDPCELKLKIKEEA